MQRRIFIDVDGVLAEFVPVDTIEKLYEPGYFFALQPQENVVRATKALAADSDNEVFILSAVLSEQAKKEKDAWLDQYLPEIATGHRLYPMCGTDKAKAVVGGVRADDILIDDYTKNLMAWPGIGIKLLNGINHTKGTWKGYKVSKEQSAMDMVKTVLDYAALSEGEITVAAKKRKIKREKCL